MHLHIYIILKCKRSLKNILTVENDSDCTYILIPTDTSVADIS